MKDGSTTESKNLQVLEVQLFLMRRGEKISQLFIFSVLNCFMFQSFFYCCHIKFMNKSSGKHRKSGCPDELEMNEPLLF